MLPAGTWFSYSMHGQSYLAGGIYLLCRQRSPVAWGRASGNTAQGARSDSGLLPLGKVPESGAGGGHASLEDWVRCYRNSNNRAVRMAHSVLERVQPSPRHAESFQGAPRRIPASLKVWLFALAAELFFAQNPGTKLPSSSKREGRTCESQEEEAGKPPGDLRI